VAPGDTAGAGAVERVPPERGAVDHPLPDDAGGTGGGPMSAEERAAELVFRIKGQCSDAGIDLVIAYREEILAEARAEAEECNCSSYRTSRECPAHGVVVDR
jgi:hypothetical protein